jgi:hypothetical protein
LCLVFPPAGRSGSATIGKKCASASGFLAC